MFRCLASFLGQGFPTGGAIAALAPALSSPRECLGVDVSVDSLSMASSARFRREAAGAPKIATLRGAMDRRSAETWE